MIINAVGKVLKNIGRTAANIEYPLSGTDLEKVFYQARARIARPQQVLETAKDRRISQQSARIQFVQCLHEVRFHPHGILSSVVFCSVSSFWPGGPKPRK